MEIIWKGKDFERSFKNPVLTLGNFDGVHLGHQRIFQRVREKANEIGGESIAYTFHPHPVQMLKPERSPFLLLPVEERLRLIEETGMEVAICAPFTREFASLTAEEFVRHVLHEQIRVWHPTGRGRWSLMKRAIGRMGIKRRMWVGNI